MAPSVVTIDVTGGTAAGTGSGIVLRSDGYILTNDHVVTLDGVQPAVTAQISVVMSNGNRLAATVVGTDTPDDLAVVKVNATGLRAATFANSSSLHVGQPVLAIGAPLGLSDTVTSGIVSALNRPVQAGDNGAAIFDAVQTDAAINPGNSGGSLVNLSGQVVGVDAASASTGSSGAGQPGSIGIGFAIPANEASRVANQLITNGTATHATLGVSFLVAAAENLVTPDGGAGATILTVTPGSPAAVAGIQLGDVITAVGSQRISGRIAAVAAIRSYAPRQTATLQVTRNGNPMTVAVTLAASSAG
jgi:putative serine protease PepD